MWLALSVLMSLGFAQPGVPCLALGDDSILVASASFTIRDSEGGREQRYRSDTNLLFCRTTSATMTWIRFAESRENDGGAGPHLDIDICGLTEGGVFGPMEARAKPCPGGQTWGVWWHASATQAFATAATSSPCRLEVVVAPSRITGTFACDGLTTASAAEQIDIQNGRFDFAIVPKE